MPVFGVVILAAGSSRRMGQPKLLLPWRDTTIIGRQIKVWQILGSNQIAVVHRPDDTALPGELDRLRFPTKDRIANAQADEGMFSSVRCAAKWNGWQSDLSHWIVALGDQPHLKEETLRAVLALSAAEPEKVCQPLYASRARHPVVLPGHIFREICNSRASTLKEFLAERRIATVELNDSGLGLDIDYPADYQKAIGLI